MGNFVGWQHPCSILWTGSIFAWGYDVEQFSLIAGQSTALQDEFPKPCNLSRLPSLQSMTFLLPCSLCIGATRPCNGPAVLELGHFCLELEHFLVLLPSSTSFLSCKELATKSTPSGNGKFECRVQNVKIKSCYRVPASLRSMVALQQFVYWGFFGPSLP